MPKYIQIQIPEPCREEWHNMPPVSNGRFCDSCQKKVIDFTLMSDSQLLEFFKKNPSGGCGRFYTDQLAHPIPIPARKIPWVKYFFQITIPAMLFSFKAGAQKFLHKNMVEVVVPAKPAQQSYDTAGLMKVTGRVTDADGMPIGFATVMVSGKNRGGVADSDGRFSIAIKITDRFLEVSCVGFLSDRLTVDPLHTNFQAVLKSNHDRFQQSCVVVGGISSGVVVRSARAKKKKSNEKSVIVNNVNNAITVFPNPVQSFSSLTIRWKTPVKANQELAIYDITGMLVQKDLLHINNYTHEISIKIKLTHTGNYILHVTDTDTGKVLITQILVE